MCRQPNGKNVLRFVLNVIAFSLGFTPSKSAFAADTGASVPKMESSSRQIADIVFGSRTAREDWTGAAMLSKSNRSWIEWLNGQRAAHDDWVARKLERADLIGGWVHDYVDPVTGRPLIWSATTPEPLVGNSDRESRQKQAWVASMREVNILRAQSAARMFRLTGDARYATWAAEQLDFYAKNYERWPLRTENGRGRMFRHGLDEAVYAFALLDTARLLEPYSSTQRTSLWRDGLFFPMAENLKKVTTPRSNIALWHYAAIAGIAMRYQNTAMLNQALDGSDGLRTTLNAGLTTDNIWIEGSFAYNNYVVDSLAKLLLLATIEGYSARINYLADAVSRALLAPIEFRFSDGSLPTPGDAVSGALAIDETLHMRLFRVLPTYFGLKRASQEHSWDALIDPPGALPSSPPTLPAVQTKNFPAVRMAVLRRGDWQAFVHYGQVTPNHAQEEALTYELNHGLSALFRDAGTVAYSSPYHANYFRRAAANNVPLIDGGGQAEPALGKILSFSPENNRLVVLHETYRPNARVERAFQVTAEGFIETTSINLAIDGPRRLGAAVHTTCNVIPAGGLNAAQTASKPPPTQATAYWSNIRAFDAGANWSIRLACPGNKDYTLQVDGPNTQQVFIAQTPSTPIPALRNVIYYEAFGNRATFSLSIRALPLR